MIANEKAHIPLNINSLMKILIIDDEYHVVKIIQKQLKDFADQTFCADSYEVAYKMSETQIFDLIICDYHLSSTPYAKQGIDFIRSLRQRKIQTPILLLTARSMEEITPWEALDAGVDDFLKKPYHKEEFIARLKAILRRSFKCSNNSTNNISHKSVVLDLSNKRVFLAKKEISLGNILFLLLQQFIKSPNKLITHEFFIEYLWGESALYDKQSSNTLRVHINHLKNALGVKYGKNIKTVYGSGYMWKDA